MLQIQKMENRRKLALSVLSESLLNWYPMVKRDLPWRRDPSPYHVWISEIMLQQTRIEAVKGYYSRFLAYFPELVDLASADEQTVLKVWEGLGYYSRARNLMKAAQICVDQYSGNLPSDYQQLKKLPGIGSYTAGAVGSIAFALPVPAVDGNVLRVMSRYLADASDITKAGVRTRMEKLLLGIIPADHPGEFNQALMELGETLCIPNGTPLCSSCPLQKSCIAYQQGNAEDYPVKSAKKPRKIQDMTVLLLRRDDRFCVRQRPEKGLLANMFEFPWIEGHLTRSEMEAWMMEQGIHGRIIQELPQAKHVFSHVEWHMIGWEIETNVSAEQLGNFYTPTELHASYPIPVAMKKYDQYLTEIML